MKWFSAYFLFADQTDVSWFTKIINDKLIGFILGLSEACWKFDCVETNRKRKIKNRNAKAETKSTTKLLWFDGLIYIGFIEQYIENVLVALINLCCFFL